LKISYIGLTTNLIHISMYKYKEFIYFLTTIISILALAWVCYHVGVYEGAIILFGIDCIICSMVVIGVWTD